MRSLGWLVVALASSDAIQVQYESNIDLFPAGIARTATGIHITGTSGTNACFLLELQADDTLNGYTQVPNVNSCHGLDGNVLYGSSQDASWTQVIPGSPSTTGILMDVPRIFRPEAATVIGDSSARTFLPISIATESSNSDITNVWYTLSADNGVWDASTQTPVGNDVRLSIHRFEKTELPEGNAQLQRRRVSYFTNRDGVPESVYPTDIEILNDSQLVVIGYTAGQSGVFGVRQQFGEDTDGFLFVVDKLTGALAANRPNRARVPSRIPRDDQLDSVCVHNGFLYLVGMSQGEVDPTRVQNEIMDTPLILKLNADTLEPVWIKQLDRGHAKECAVFRNVLWVAGSVDGDLFAATMDLETGNVVQKETFGTNAEEGFGGFAIIDGRPLLVGFTYGSWFRNRSTQNVEVIVMDVVFSPNPPTPPPPTPTPPTPTPPTPTPPTPTPPTPPPPPTPTTPAPVFVLSYGPPPTDAPTTSPVAAPTRAPVVAPTVAPTRTPVASPTIAPTRAPVASPTGDDPSFGYLLRFPEPTTSPVTPPPTKSPVAQPTARPTTSPTSSPVDTTAAPTGEPKFSIRFGSEAPTFPKLITAAAEESRSVTSGSVVLGLMGTFLALAWVL